MARPARTVRSALQCLPHMPRRADRIAHVVQAVLLAMLGQHAVFA
jgi:hypothetical protein